MSQEKPEHLKLIDDAEGEHYSSRAVFSDVGLGVEVKEYENFTLYHWRGDSGFDEVLNAVEPYFPLVENPALEMLEEKMHSGTDQKGTTRNFRATLFTIQ
ncbi:MAG: hypothetical protein ABEK10_02510 [Candidatus Nanosalina sp.]